MLLDAVLLLPPPLAAAATVEGGAFPLSSVSIFRSAPQQVKVNRAWCLPQRLCPPRPASMRCTYTALPTTGRRAKYNHSTRKWFITNKGTMPDWSFRPAQDCSPALTNTNSVQFVMYCIWFFPLHCTCQHLFVHLRSGINWQP